MNDDKWADLPDELSNELAAMFVNPGVIRDIENKRLDRIEDLATLPMVSRRWLDELIHQLARISVGQRNASADAIYSAAIDLAAVAYAIASHASYVLRQAPIPSTHDPETGTALSSLLAKHTEDATAEAAADVQVQMPKLSEEARHDFRKRSHPDGPHRTIKPCGYPMPHDPHSYTSKVNRLSYDCLGRKHNV